jgi:hypothetical protein
MDEIARGGATAVRRALRGFDRDADTDEVGGTSSDRVAVLGRAGADNPANALVGVVPTHTGLSFQRLGNKLVALLRRSPGFLADRPADVGIIREQKLQHVVMPLMAADFAWSTGHLYAPASRFKRIAG